MKTLKKIKVIAGILVVCAVIAFLTAALIKKYTPNDSMMALSEYYTVEDGRAMLLLETALAEENARLVGNGIYLPFAMVKELCSPEFYLDEAEGILSYALPNELLLVYEGESCYYSCEMAAELIGRPGEQTIKEPKLRTQALEAPALLKLEGRYYISMEFAGRFSNMEYEYYENPCRLIVHYQWNDFLYFDTSEETPVRVEASIKSEVLAFVPPETKLYYISGTGTGSKSFIRVMTKDGIFGYVQRKFLSDSYYEARHNVYQEPEYTHLTREGKVRLGWHQITVAEANAKLESVVENASEMNVISPTWYRVVGADGSISSLADAVYVEQAHQKGLAVWALVDNFDKKVDSLALLSSTRARAALIRNLVNSIQEYRIDGINIDFESLPSAAGVHFVQFIKELSVVCRNRGIVLSVDNYVPASYNGFYDLQTQGKVVDYVIIMAYDEHYAGSSEAGSVASIGFVKNAVNNTLAKMSKERIIMGIPFYCRLWKEAGGKLSSEALSMAGTKTFLARNALKPEWEDATGQYYAECEAEGALYRVWMEEETSLTEKLKVISSADVAGVAAWRLGFEAEGIWELLEYYMR